MSFDSITAFRKELHSFLPMLSHVICQIMEILLIHTNIGGNMDDMDLAEGCLNINVIVSGAPQGDQLHPEFIQLFDYCTVHNIVHENTDNIASLCKLSCILVQLRLQEPELHIVQAPISFKRRFVILLCVIKCDLDHGITSLVLVNS